ncbi:hypothetical protein NIES3974_05320 [Calothrix sp. NIES-3974]|nr:hypothetical protein NIES3974_05320 [Calothrix sp. NIES-3974]
MLTKNNAIAFYLALFKQPLQNPTCQQFPANLSYNTHRNQLLNPLLVLEYTGDPNDPSNHHQTQKRTTLSI